MKFEKKKSLDAMSEMMHETIDFGKKTATNVKAGFVAAREKSRLEEYNRKMKKYNPLFPKDYESEKFNLPNIVVIVDDAVRRDIDVCEGAIGWLNKDSGEEVLYLYDEAIAFSGLKFIPTPVCNAVYYVDNFDRNKFIQVDCVFSRTLKEKIDELQHIAEYIGAKRCLIHIREASKTQKSKTKRGDVGVDADEALGNFSLEYKEMNNSGLKQYGHVEAEFGGLRFPKRPTLKWFLHDDSIINLIEACCSGKRRVKKLTLKLTGSSHTTMSNSMACAIDGVINQTVKAKSGLSIRSQAKEERQSELLFHIEF